MAPRTKSQLCILFVVLVLATSTCQVPESADSAVATTPVPPDFGDTLPMLAEIECPDPGRRKFRVALWEHVAREPLDVSDSNPDRGSYMGYVQPCSEVTVLDYQWSEFYEEYWVFIETDKDIRGWLSSEFVDFGQ